MNASSWWDRHKAAVLETFVLSNYAFLILDVSLAHAVNRFRHGAEWIPVGFSVVAVLVLAPALVLRVRERGYSFAQKIAEHGPRMTRGLAMGDALLGVLGEFLSEKASRGVCRSTLRRNGMACPSSLRSGIWRRVSGKKPVAR